MNLRSMTFLPVALAALTASLTAEPAAQAQQRKSLLEGQPVVRHKMELRDKRFELAPSFDMSIAADYKTTLGFGAKIEYHLTDMLSIGGMIYYGRPLNTGLTNQIEDSLPDSPGTDPTPSKSQFTEHLNELTLHGGAHATFTPWFGKISLFGKAFINFDVYIQGGLGFAQTKSEWDDSDGPVTETCYNVCIGEDGKPYQCEPYECYTDPRNDAPQNSGFNPGLLVGVGVHAFINKWIALDLSVRDYVFSDNPSGLDFDGDNKVDGDDKRFLSHLFFGLGVSMYFPPKIKVSP